MMTRTSCRESRRGAVLVLFVILLMAICGFLALALDIGVMAVARTQAQGAVDAAVMAGVRQLNGNTATNNNSSAVLPAAQATASANQILAQNFVGSVDLPTVYVGKYYYDNTQQKFLSYFPGNSAISDAGAVNDPSQNFTAVYGTLTHTGMKT